MQKLVAEIGWLRRVKPWRRSCTVLSRSKKVQPDRPAKNFQESLGEVLHVTVDPEFSTRLSFGLTLRFLALSHIVVADRVVDWIACIRGLCQQCTG